MVASMHALGSHGRDEGDEGDDRVDRVDRVDRDDRDDRVDRVDRDKKIGRGLALVPLLAPRSASEAYCRGALRVGTSWEGLQVRSRSRCEVWSSDVD